MGCAEVTVNQTTVEEMIDEEVERHLEVGKGAHLIEMAHLGRWMKIEE